MLRCQSQFMHSAMAYPVPEASYSNPQSAIENRTYSHQRQMMKRGLALVVLGGARMRTDSSNLRLLRTSLCACIGSVEVLAEVQPFITII